MAKMIVQKDKKVKVHYTGTLNDGSIFDTSENSDPLEFTVGLGQMIPGFEKAVEGMKLHEEKEVTISAEEAYGERDETLMRDFPKTSLAEDFTPAIGMVIGLSDNAGRTYPATVAKVAEESITLDLNHPLAGQDLNFKIKVISIE